MASYFGRLKVQRVTASPATRPAAWTVLSETATSSQPCSPKAFSVSVASPSPSPSFPVNRFNKPFHPLAPIFPAGEVQVVVAPAPDWWASNSPYSHFAGCLPPFPTPPCPTAPLPGGQSRGRDAKASNAIRAAATQAVRFIVVLLEVAAPRRPGQWGGERLATGI